jgi:hypothetical protein
MASVDEAARQLKYADATMAVEDASPVGKRLGAEQPSAATGKSSSEDKAKKPGFFDKLRAKQAEKAAEK